MCGAGAWAYYMERGRKATKHLYVNTLLQRCVTRKNDANWWRERKKEILKSEKHVRCMKKQTIGARHDERRGKENAYARADSHNDLRLSIKEKAFKNRPKRQPPPRTSRSRGRHTSTSDRRTHRFHWLSSREYFTNRLGRWAMNRRPFGRTDNGQKWSSAERAVGAKVMRSFIFYMLILCNNIVFWNADTLQHQLHIKKNRVKDKLKRKNLVKNANTLFIHSPTFSFGKGMSLHLSSFTLSP